MATLAATITRLCDDLSRPESEIGEVARREILSAINFYAGRRFAFNELLLNATFSATNAYTFERLIGAASTSIADILAIDQVKVSWSNNSYSVDRMNWIDLNALDVSNISTSGPPDYWAIYNKTLQIYPPLNTSMSVRLAVHVKFLELTDDAENAWLTDGEELIRSRASKAVCARKLDDFEKSQIFAAMEGEALKSLQERVVTLVATGSLSPND